MFNFEILNPEFFFILLIIPIFYYFLYKKSQKNPIFGAFSDLKNIFKTNSKIFIFKNFLISLSIFCFVLFFANVKIIDKIETEKKSLSLVFVLDISESMNAKDFWISRLQTVKNFINDFFEKQKNLKTWVIYFWKNSFIWNPISSDFKWISENIKNISSKFLDKNDFWSNVSDALLLAKNLFLDKNEEKIIILFSDWDFNSGIKIENVAKNLEKEKIKVFSFWVWWKNKNFLEFKNGEITQKIEVSGLIEKDLKNISDITNAKFFNMNDKNSLENLQNEIQKIKENKLKTSEKIYKSIDFEIIFVIFVLLFVLFFLELNFFKNIKNK